jgi:dynein heavy chain
MMFEVEDLVHASPATVSRCGMVFLETKNLGWRALVKAFGKKIHQNLHKEVELILSTLQWFLEACLAYVKKNGKFPMDISDMNMTFTTLNLVSILFQPFEVENVKLPKDLEDQINNIIFFAVVWAIGATLEEGARPGFHEFVLKLLACNDVVDMFNIDIEGKFEPRAYKFKLNDPTNIFDIMYDAQKGLWLNWIQTIPAFTIPKGTQFHQLIIPTVESLRTAWFMNLMSTNKKHILFTGPTGTGKTISIVNEININFSNDQYANLTTCFSGQTGANQLQRTIETKMSTRRRKGVFGPEDRKPNMIIFIDDLNMPAKEVYDA